ncbi:probable protein S-acyltransferase 12 isoform X1 [Nymphaea colorata]|nr:probable protein S-acyltransferase 12 isoform X1 [Nymphaea colorata]
MAWDGNLFKFCSGLRVLGYLMILLVGGIVAVSYDAVVVVTCGSLLRLGGVRCALSVVIIAVFHLLLLLLLWSYFLVVFTDPGSVPQNWQPMADENPVVASSTASSEYADLEIRSSGWSPSGEPTRRPGIRYCNSCQNVKPPRCHHCSVCQRCVLKMDHHCIWVVNCVGARNYKFFLLFLLYTFLETTLDTLVLLPEFIRFFGEINSHSSSPGNLAVTFLAFVINLAFALSLLGFVILHLSLLLSNTTTIEVYEKKTAIGWRYDLGKRKNVEQVFGKKRAYWLLPLYSKEDLEKIPALQGLEFPIRSDAEV